MLVSVAIALVAGLSDCGNDALAGPHSFSADCSLFFFFCSYFILSGIFLYDFCTYLAGALCLLLFLCVFACVCYCLCLCLTFALSEYESVCVCCGGRAVGGWARERGRRKTADNRHRRDAQHE